MPLLRFFKFRIRPYGLSCFGRTKIGDIYSLLSWAHFTMICFANNFSISLSSSVSPIFEKPILLMGEKDGGLSIKSNFRPEIVSIISGLQW